MTSLISRVFLTFVVLVVVLCGIYYFRNKQLTNDLYTGYEKIEYTLENKKLNLLVADTPEKREKGLMFYKSLEGVDGMIFIFPQKQMLTFWNKNTFMDLDIYWISDEAVAGKSFLPSIEKSKEVVVLSSPGAVERVIEIPAN